MAITLESSIRHLGLIDKRIAQQSGRITERMRPLADQHSQLPATLENMGDVKSILGRIPS